MNAPVLTYYGEDTPAYNDDIDMDEVNRTIPDPDTAPSFAITPQWITAGKAIFTVHNASGTHYTYRVAKVESDDRPAAWFIGLLTGSDNESDYSYLGMLDPRTGAVRLTKASRMTEDSTPVKVIRWALRLIWTGKDVPTGYGIHHECRCGRCGRTLTAPAGVSDEGYRYGFGPVCWERIQNGE